MGTIDITEEVKELYRPYARMKDPAAVENKIRKLIADGPDKLQVIADFDLTLSKQHVNGTKQLSSFCFINHCKNIPSHFSETDRAICAKYIPIQTDPNLSKTEKIPFMEEFYGETSKLYTGFKFSRDDIKEAVNSSPLDLRDGTIDLVSQLETNGIPMLVFSAGLGDVVTAVLENSDCLRPNVHVLSNFLKFKDGYVDGFQKDVIHPYNKNGRAASHSPYFENMKNRGNVILMGDSIGDDEMADGLPNTEAVLKIGFNWDRDDLLPSFLEHYDVVLIDDQSMDLANAIVRSCVKQTEAAKA